jgi:hypothetical protein
MPANTNPSPAEIVAALQRGGIVAALKLVLAAKGIGAGEEKKGASDALDARPKPFGSTPPSSNATGLSPGEVPRSNSDLRLLLAIAALCIAYHVFFDR